MKSVTASRSVWICCVPLFCCECPAQMMSLHIFSPVETCCHFALQTPSASPPKVDETFPFQVLHVRKSILAQILNPLSVYEQKKSPLFTLTQDIKLGSVSLMTPYMWHLSHSGSYFPWINTLPTIHIAHIFKNIRNLFSVTPRKSIVQFRSGKQKPKSQNKANQVEEYRLALEDTVFGRST